ncbi:hypothetical protein SAMN05216548_10524 [Faunimonas pinastri]|uniref:Uncharacterized protein n=1 Tax=Faunimonas pinastri TaxID=1855383 RepID=A0A1H9GFK3_9HYPH|nr:hypothetical protein [Faunimonas pinastri]SEQ48882.1 hypothetical protein SAMN05216548_10524 [Faunimonas pinastri]
MTTWTQADLAAIDAAIATGASRVRFADNREVFYRSLAEMRSVRRDIAAALGGTVTAPRVTLASFRRD